ncbi:sensor histidine kinase [Pengzhenrongella frigida]|uniref:Signal transduction histidine-protein kinase/phosphatase MprB n=1 Tax=Pengzhenrongella frigida TaxID=1259133 RepID=A0A4Q5N5C7_9MICO|nr:HAMP domain-containing sensor histidine kinase [Cellulomonas sp. HLT2-17]RYV52703.1 HAMP domain-containing histidine kinase [Cellulomonas sp. HLT2-17]
MRRLLVQYGLAMTSVVLVAFLVPLGILARSLALERALDAGLRDAQSVAVFAGGAAQDEARLEATILSVNDDARRTTVFLPDATSMGEPATRSPAAEVAASGRALTARADGGVEVLLPVGSTAGLAVVRTFVPDSELTSGVRQSWLVLATVGAVLLAGTVLAGDRIARRLARSVTDLSDVAERLGAGELTARVAPSGPAEVASVGRVLNGLGARVAGLLADERELVADLSHRLRTPITALRLDVDLLTEPQERERMSGHVDELVRAVDAIVWTARHPRHDDASHGRCDAARVVRERARFWAVLAADQGRELRVEVPDGVLEVGVGAGELGVALDVLVDNVFSHTPDRVPFGLAVRTRPGVVEVVVEDDGPGFERPDAVDRGRSGAGSTGLGLDVARRTAEKAAGRLVLGASATGGARVVLELPA